MSTARGDIGPIHVLAEFVCEAIPGSAVNSLAEKPIAKSKKSNAPNRQRPGKAPRTKNRPAKTKPQGKKRPPE